MVTSSDKSICFIQYRDKLETNIDHLSMLCRKQGYDVSILGLTSFSRDIETKKDRRKFINIRLPWNYNKKLSKLLFIYKVINILKRNKYSIVHIDHTCNYFAILKLFYPKAKYLFHIQSFPVIKNNLKLLKMMVLIFLQCIIMDAVIIQSEEQQKEFFGFNRLKKVHLVPVGTNCDLFFPFTDYEKKAKRQALNIKQDEIILIYSGNMNPLRELERLFMAIRIVVDKHPKVKLLMVGNNDEALHLKKAASEMHLTENIFFVGEIPHEQMNCFYGASDIGISFVPINRYYTYNPPLKTFEYLACGLPCIATRTIANAKVIRDQHNGILVDDSPLSISSAISNLITDTSKIEKLRHNSRDSVLSYDFTNIAQKYLFPIYSKL